MRTLYRGIEPETLVYNVLSGADTDWFTLDQQIKAIKYGSGIVLSSVTANLSLVAGTAFITNPLVDLRKYIGFKATVNATADAVGWLKAAGTGETLDTERYADPSFDASGSWTQDAGWAVTGGKAVATTAAYGTLTRQLVAFTDGMLVKSSVTCDNITAGNYTHRLTNSLVLSAHTTTGTKIDYYTSPANDQWRGVLAYDAGATASFTDISMKQVLTPSATGVTVVSAQGGSTYNWTSDAGIAPNAASFTITITAA